MRGASALQQVLADRPGAPVRLLVVWEPVIPTDVGPPTTGAMATLPDPRVRQFWDPERVVSHDLLRAYRGRLGQLGLAQDQAPPGFIVWDHAMVFEPGGLWRGNVPKPSYAGGIVVEVTEYVAGEVDRLLADRQ